MVVLAGLYSRVKVCFLCIPLLLSSLMIPQGWGRDRKWLRTSDLWEMVKTDACLKSLYFCLFGFFFFLVSPWGFPGGSVGKESTCNAGDLGSIPWLGRSPGWGHDNPLQYSYLDNLHGQRSLVGYSPCGRKELDTTEGLRTDMQMTPL